MRAGLLYILLSFLLLPYFSEGQAEMKAQAFDHVYWNRIADKKQLNATERIEFLTSHQRTFVEEQRKLNFQPLSLPETSAHKGYGTGTIFAGPCTNIDFESGNMSGWTRTCGFHPLYNATGCCPNPNGQQTIMTGTGLDPFGLFPVVFPGGNFSLRLGNSGVNGQADRISQTFFVTAANANFTYRYAVVLQDPGHNVSEQPAFVIEMVDSLGSQIPCTTYSVTAGSNIPGFFPSPNTANVYYKPWTNVAMDLTPVIGQNVTIRFTTYDCALGGHFGYAYVDGLCTNFATSSSDTTCTGTPFNMCGPVGFATYNWNGPGVVNNANRCINASAAGVYTCQTILVPGCPGPTFTHTLVTLAKPVLSFTASATSACSTQYSFASTSGIASGSIVSYQWFFGDNTTSTLLNPTHAYSGTGTYNIKFKATSNLGCSDSVLQTITIYPFPALAFSPPSNCVNTVVQFTNTSSIAAGSIASYTWNLGNGAMSNAVNPANTYTANGTYTILLGATSNQGCVSTLTQTLGIFPPPIISFSANPLCDINGTSFSPSTSTAIVSGSLVGFSWNFGDGGTSTAANPVHIYASAGTYTVSFTATSNHACVQTVTNSFIISPTPTVSFNTFSVNNCSFNYTFASTSGGVGPLTYNWNFGGTGTSTLSSVSYTFPLPGSYTISLIATTSMGCSDTAFYPVTIFPVPSVSLGIPASCENAVFTGSAMPLSGSVTSFQWNFGDPLSGASNTSTLQNPTHNYAVTGNYTVSLLVTSNVGCTASYSTATVVYPNPVANFTFSTINACSLPYTFINSSAVTPTTNNSMAGYIWDFGSSGTSNVAAPSFTFPSNGTYSVSLIAITSHNCSDTITRVLNVHPFPQLSFSVNPVCLTTAASFTSSASISPVPDPLAGISSYTWNYGDNSTGGSAVSPPHTYTADGQYTVTMSATSNQGCVSTVTSPVVIYPMPVIDFTITSSHCFGNTTSFSSTNSINSPGSINAFNWDFGDGGGALVSNPVHTYTTAGNYAVNYSVTSGDGCTTIITKTVVIFPLPVIATSGNDACLNNPTQFTTTVNITSPSISSYSWNFGDGNGSSGQNPAYTYTAFSTNGPYVATLTAVSVQGCSASATTSITIFPLPNVSFTPPGACVNSIVQFSNSTTIPSPGSIASYSWNFANGSTSGAMNPTATFTTYGAYNVSLTATSGQGCTVTAVNNFSVHPLPQATITPMGNNCQHNAVTFTPNPSIATGAITSYTWNFGDSNLNISTGTVSNPPPVTVHTYSTYNSYTISLSMLSDHNCAYSTNITFTIYPTPVPSFSATHFCESEATLFFNTSTIPLASLYPITGHYWEFDGINVSAVHSPSFVFAGPGTYTVKLTETSNPESGLDCIATASNVIVINPLPLVSFTNTNACDGAPITFSNTSLTSGTNNVVSWSWDFDYNGSPNSNTAGPNNYTYPGPGTYTAALTATNTFSCVNTFSNVVIVHPNPVASFTTNSVCQGDSTVFANLSTGATTFSWSFGGGGSSALVNPRHMFPAAGVYTTQLTVFSGDGCTNKSTGTFSVHFLPGLLVGGSEACLGKSTVFANSSYVQSGFVARYLWDYENDGYDDSSATPNITPVIYSSAGNHIFRLKAVSDKGCQSTTTISVRVRDNPIADFSNSGRICTGEKMTFNDLSTPVEGSITTRSWDFNGDNFQDFIIGQPAYTYTGEGKYNVKLEVTTQYGCANSVKKTVHVNPKPRPQYLADKNSGCPPLCVNFQNLSTISSGTFTTQWTFGDQSDKVNQNNPSHCFNSSGSFDLLLTLTSDSGCVSEMKQPGYVIAYDKPQAGFSVNPDEIDEDDPIIDVHSTASDNDYIHYFVSDGTHYSTINFTHKVKNPDSKSKPMVVQIVRNKYGCADTVYKVIDVKPTFVIYFPNVFTPNGDDLNDVFMAKGVGITKFAMQIYDRWGEEVFSTREMNYGWDGRRKGSFDPIKQDVYTWKAQVVDVFNQPHEYIGHVTLLK